MKPLDRKQQARIILIKEKMRLYPIKEEAEEEYAKRELVKLGYEKELVEEAFKLNKIPDSILAILKNPNLFKEITEQEFDKKIVGEKESRKIIFLCAAGGRLVENAQIASYNLLVNDDAGAGKDYVAGAVLSILPEEVYIHKTRISPTAFSYWHNEPEWTWDGKVFYPEDISENVLNSDVFKVMCSSGSSAMITQKINGKMIALDIQIKGKPVMITTTATAVPNPELTRRFGILNLDSSEEQTKAIMKRHSEFKKRGIVPAYETDYTRAISFLQRVKIKIPFADLIDAVFPSKNIVMRTNYPRFLDFIAASAAFHQFQREQDKEGYIIAAPQDYDIARECFLKLVSNKYMISLTINQKKILDVFEKSPTLSYSATQWHPKMHFVSLPALQTNLGILVKYGILESKIDKDSMNRDIEVYTLSNAYNPNEKINIPFYEELCRNTLPSLTPLTPLQPLISLTSTQESGDIKDVKDIKAIKCIENNPISDIVLCPKCNSSKTHQYSDVLTCDNCKGRFY